MPLAEQDRYLIIGGTTKAATTSLFNYLAAHPEVCASTRKETRFFIDEDYFLPLPKIHFSQGLEKYNTFFINQVDSASVRLEATPDYLYSSTTAEKIKTSLPNVKAVFILREPISRLVSWYRYAKQKALIPESMKFEEYVEKQLKSKNSSSQEESNNEPKKEIPQSYFFDMLQQGCYSDYLRSYITALGRENVYIGFYEEICLSPRSVSQEVCKFAQIDPAFFDEYQFEVFNKTKTMKNPKLHGAYEKLATSIRQYTFNSPFHSSLKKLKKWFDKSYYDKLNTASTNEKVEISSELKSKLEDYYRPEKAALGNLLERPLPW